MNYLEKYQNLFECQKEFDKIEKIKQKYLSKFNQSSSNFECNFGEQKHKRQYNIQNVQIFNKKSIKKIYSNQNFKILNVQQLLDTVLVQSKNFQYLQQNDYQNLSLNYSEVDINLSQSAYLQRIWQIKFAKLQKLINQKRLKTKYNTYKLLIYNKKILKLADFVMLKQLQNYQQGFYQILKNNFKLNRNLSKNYKKKYNVFKAWQNYCNMKKRLQKKVFCYFLLKRYFKQLKRLHFRNKLLLFLKDKKNMLYLKKIFQYLKNQQKKSKNKYIFVQKYFTQKYLYFWRKNLQNKYQQDKKIIYIQQKQIKKIQKKIFYELVKQYREKPFTIKSIYSLEQINYQNYLFGLKKLIIF